MARVAETLGVIFFVVASAVVSAGRVEVDEELDGKKKVLLTRKGYVRIKIGNKCNSTAEANCLAYHDGESWHTVSGLDSVKDKADRERTREDFVDHHGAIEEPCKADDTNSQIFLIRSPPKNILKSVSHIAVQIFTFDGTKCLKIDSYKEHQDFHKVVHVAPHHESVGDYGNGECAHFIYSAVRNTLYWSSPDPECTATSPYCAGCVVADKSNELVTSTIQNARGSTPYGLYIGSCTESCHGRIELEFMEFAGASRILGVSSEDGGNRRRKAKKNRKEEIEEPEEGETFGEEEKPRKERYEEEKPRKERY